MNPCCFYFAKSLIMGLCMLKYYASLTHLQGKLGKFLQRLSLPTAEVGDVDGIMLKRIQRLSSRSESRRAKERTLTRSDWHVISLTAVFSFPLVDTHILILCCLLCLAFYYLKNCKMRQLLISFSCGNKSVN